MSETAELRMADLRALRSDGSLARLIADEHGHLFVRESEDSGEDPHRFIYTYLTDSSGVTDLAVNGSVTPVEYTFTAPSECVLERINFALVDDVKSVPNGFFTIVALTNGLTIQVRYTSGAVRQHFGTDIVPITTHSSLGALAGVDVSTDTTANLTGANVRWTLSAGSGHHMQLQAGETVTVTVRDNLSAITTLSVMAQGHLLGELL